MTQKIGQTREARRLQGDIFKVLKGKEKYKDSYHQQNHIQKCRLNKDIPRKAYGRNIYL